MFAYCGNNPVIFSDPSGCLYFLTLDMETHGFLSSTLQHYTGGGGGINLAAGVENIDGEFSLIEETVEITNGTKTGTFLGGSIDFLSATKDEITFFSVDASVISIVAKKGFLECSPLDIGNAELALGLKSGLPYAEAMVSLWSPSVEVDAWGLTVELTAHVGALGAKLSLVPGEYQIGYAKGFGFSISIT